MMKNLKDSLKKWSAILTIAGAETFLTFTPVLAEGDGVLGYDIATGSVPGAGGDLVEAGQKAQATGNKIYKIIVAIALIVVMAFFVFKAVKLSRSGDNPQERSKAIEGLVHALIAVALIGGATILSSWVYGVLK